MVRKNYIEIIEELYPADEHETGKEIMLKAIADTWRCLPDEVLQRYAYLCQEYDKINQW